MTRELNGDYWSSGPLPSPGRTELSLEGLNDRLAILNLLGAYAHFANLAEFDLWSGLFTEDATFALSAPGADGEPLPIAHVFRAERVDFDGRRKILLNPGLDERKWYYIQNPYVIQQNDCDAEITADLVNARILPSGPVPRIQNCGTFRGTVVKREGVWKIHRWSVKNCRVPEPLSELPATWWVNVAANPDGDWRG
jgi:hypothetical protein